MAAGTSSGRRIESLLVDVNIDLGRAAGTYDIVTASGDVVIESIAFHVTTAATLLTSAAVKTDDTTVNTVLTAVVLAALLDGAALTPYAGALLLRSGKKLQVILVGLTGTGTLRMIARYRTLPSNPGARLAAS